MTQRNIYIKRFLYRFNIPEFSDRHNQRSSNKKKGFNRTRL